MKLASLLSLALTAGAVTVLATATAAQAAPGVTPPGVSLTLGPGQSADIAKHVETAPVPPKPDIVFLADTTGSMTGPIADVRANAASVLGQIAAAQPQARFGVAEYKDFEDSAPFTVRQDVTADQAAVQAGIGQWVAGGGGDLPEDGINALFQLANGAVHFRDGGTRIIVMFGDAPSHDPSLGHHLADTVAALNAAHIRVVAVDVGAMNTGGQAEAITSGTGGVYLPNVPADQVSAAILAGVQAIQVKVTPVVLDCAADLSVTFDPAAKTVDSGAAADFTEHVTVAGGAAPGTYTCKVDFTVDGVSQGAAFVQTLSVTVLTMSVNDVVVDENAGTATFTVSLSGPPTSPVSANYATADGTATAGADYTAGGGTVTFQPGQTSRPVTVPIVDDALDELDETFTVNLSAATGAAIADGTGLGTIVDADRNGTFSCTAQVLRVGPLSSPAANPAGVPCVDDGKVLAQLTLDSGLIKVESKTLDANTALTPDDLGTAPAAGDNGTARATVEAVKITIGGLVPTTIELGLVQATAKATCASGPGGLAPVLSGSSSVAYLRINGVAVAVGGAPLTVPLVVGALKLNATTTTPTSVTQQAVVLDTLLTDVVIGEARADVHGSAVNPTGNPCRV
ncbi:Calx-beta domain-containing protein [Dactylosporangium sp. NPDC049742]|uniref:Calx-beta domain-containing protein n=1 Tax=Dactylosporangium sp. NPDC049742 TaxID=3154737 RepID=UPI0034195337